MTSSVISDTKSQVLRDRKIQPAHDGGSSPAESSGEYTPQIEEEVTKAKKTFGRTPNGTSKPRPGVHRSIWEIAELMCASLHRAANP